MAYLLKYLSKINSIAVVVVSSLFVLVYATADAAKPDYIFFSINGDTTGSTLTQADLFAWGSNCDSGATINWEIWYDANSNSVIDPGTDIALGIEAMADGDPLTESDPILDGFIVSNEFAMGGETGNYIFRARDIDSDVSIQRVATVNALMSPPIQVTGQITVPGYSPPNNFLANRLISAEPYNLNGVYFAVTDSMGMYTIEMDAIATDSTFWADPSNVPGFATPGGESFLASGTVSGVNFTYLVPTDSVYGHVRDDLGSVIDIESWVNAWAWNWSGGDKSVLTSDGRYVIYFSAADSVASFWGVSVYTRPYRTKYLSAGSLEFDRDTIGSFEHDFTLYHADTEIYARVTENGGPPAHQYMVWARSTSFVSWTTSLCDSGSNNIATLYVSSQDPAGWVVELWQSDDEFPIPPQFVYFNFVENVSPGDTITINLSSSSGCCIGDRGNANGDPEDKVNITDITYLIQWLFGVPNGPAPSCTEEANANGDPEEKNNITDITYLIQYLFGVPTGPEPPPCP